MSALVRALAAERIKLRHTLAAGMVVLVLTVLQLSMSTLCGPPTGLGSEAWLHFSSSLFVLWSFLMLPLFVTLQAALLGTMEHANHAWKHLLALPLPRWSHYAAKLCVLAAMVALSTLLLAALTPLAGWVVMHTQPAYGLAGSPPWRWPAEHALACIAAACCLTALQAWVALHWRSFTTSIFVGVAGTVSGFLIGQSARLGPWFPWLMPLQVFATRADHALQVVTVSLIAGALLALLGMWQFQHREQA